MSDYMLLEYLRNKGMKDGEHELINDFKKYMRSRGRGKMPRASMRHKEYQWDDMEYGRHDWDMNYEDAYRARYAKDFEGSFDEFDAKEIVSEMYHYDMNRRHTGEHFDMKKAEEVYKKHKDDFVTKASPCDVYIAINATYHDFCTVLKSWFGSNIDEKVILLAVTFWFKDDDYQGNKLMDYFE
jgi:hypothetical protein